MNPTFQKYFIIAAGVIVVLFLLLDGGAMTEATISNGIAANPSSITHSWVWIIPTLLIFGLGFLLAWFIFGLDDASTSRESMPDRRINLSALAKRKY